jgi:nanoRNase/pAp phosphatase (c-di-AMP/oligoRNAs hydrolase)
MGLSQWDVTKSKERLGLLTELLTGSRGKLVLILCHNNPDPDTIGCAAGMAFLFRKTFGIRTVLGYGGRISRAENKAMVGRLKIPMKQLSRVNPSLYHAIALVDAQPGTGNNLVATRGEPPLIVIDHHPLRSASAKAPFHDIRPNYGATSTIVTEYIVAAGLQPSRSVATALLYGIKADTRSLIRGARRVDFHAFNYLSPLSNPIALGWMESPPLSVEYFVDYHRGLSSTNIYRDAAVAYLGRIASDSIVPELADLLLRVEGITWSLCMGEIGNLMILSMRSLSKGSRAGNVIRRLVGKTGSAGGHREMAGGQIPLQGLTEDELRDMPRQLTKRFLTLIGRQGNPPRPLVDPGSCKGGLE